MSGFLYIFSYVGKFCVIFLQSYSLLPPIQYPIPNSLGQMIGGNIVSAIHIGNGPSNF